jgi:hypothetical protein
MEESFFVLSVLKISLQVHSPLASHVHAIREAMISVPFEAAEIVCLGGRLFGDRFKVSRRNITARWFGIFDFDRLAETVGRLAHLESSFSVVITPGSFSSGGDLIGISLMILGLMPRMAFSLSRRISSEEFNLVPIV